MCRRCDAPMKAAIDRAFSRDSAEAGRLRRHICNTLGEGRWWCPNLDVVDGEGYCRLALDKRPLNDQLADPAFACPAGAF
jgi:hypothetical protein